MSVIKVKPWGKGQGEYVIIEEADFNESAHSLYSPEPEPAPEKQGKKAKGKSKGSE